MKLDNNIDGRIVVFGATGTLGTYFVDHLINQGFDVFATGRRNVNSLYYRDKGIGSASVDITKYEEFSKLPQDEVFAVVQIAGLMPSRMVGYNATNYINVNVMGSLNVLEYCRQVGARKMLFTQSHSDVAGYWNTGEFIKPDAPRILNYKGDHAVYSISKNTAVDLIEHYHQDYGLQTACFRLPTIYCWRPVLDMYVNGKKRIIAYRYIIERAKHAEPLEIWGDPSVAKDIVYVKDFNQMLTKALISDKTQGMYNVATGVGTTLEEQILGAAKVFNPEDKKSRIVYCPEKPSQTSYLYNISNACEDLGYEPNYNYLQMLEDMQREMTGHRFDHLKDAVLMSN